MCRTKTGQRECAESSLNDTTAGKRHGARETAGTCAAMSLPLCPNDIISGVSVHRSRQRVQTTVQQPLLLKLKQNLRAKNLSHGYSEPAARLESRGHGAPLGGVAPGRVLVVQCSAVQRSSKQTKKRRDVTGPPKGKPMSARTNDQGRQVRLRLAEMALVVWRCRRDWGVGLLVYSKVVF